MSAVYGIDKTVIYKRKAVDYELSKFTKKQSSWKTDVYADLHPYQVKRIADNAEGTLTKFVIGYCGELYPCAISQTETESVTYWSEDDLEAEIKHRTWYSNDRGFWTPKQSMGELYEVFQTLKVPVFVISHTKLQTNPILKTYNFQKKVQAITAFQDISMYISGVLGVSEKETIVMSDEIMLLKKGFNKHSFKKEKSRPKELHKEKKKKDENQPQVYSSDTPD